MPEPAVIEVTPELVIVTAPVAPDTEIPVPATFDVTPVFVIVTPPVDTSLEIPVPAVIEVTPAFDSVTEPPNETDPPPLKPEPAVTVTALFANVPDNTPAEYVKSIPLAPVVSDTDIEALAPLTK